ncbi:MAG: oxidoreductase [Candidatus Aminicenantes bacterium RBG_13_64_14]|nr:MAG: oxidoreductase [Candidatus Aminicenantes bacterium RBG_13_64_14]
MTKTEIELQGIKFPLYSLNTLIVGSGAAALNAAVRLHGLGATDIALATESWEGGASRNAGSDKQTYYKLSLYAGAIDSPRLMAETLFRGGSMHGDIALSEAAGSIQAFFHLVEFGVPFPHDRFGSYPGYKTDNDPRQRATSAGPLTSHLMVERLAAEIERRGVTVFKALPIIALLTEEENGEKCVIGAVGLDAAGASAQHRGLTLFNCRNVVLGTGGPAGIYAASVYPESQTGSHGLAFEAGATAHNLTESHFGMASIKFRWNLSGTYQQSIPRFFSTEANGSDERAFLNDFFPDMGALATAIFLKGYEWPFDSNKIRGGGSSLIDLLVYRETVVRGRRVFLDFTHNPEGDRRTGSFSLDKLSPEARSYLERSGALLGTPLERLKKMNPSALELYAGKGIDLSREPLEIALCAQHSNGGFKASIWWESDVRRLFPVGEVCGTHGVRRPGGSALNAGQVGSMRAAMFIARRCGEQPRDAAEFVASAGPRVLERLETAKLFLDRGDSGQRAMERVLSELRDGMSRYGGPVRSAGGIGGEATRAWTRLARLRDSAGVRRPEDLALAFKALDSGLTHALYLEAMREYVRQGGRSRGSFIILDAGGEKPNPVLEDQWRFSLETEESYVGRNVLEVRYEGGKRVARRWVEVRPIPGGESWFETVWSEYLGDEIIR